jgi:hypothetical protein
LEIHLDLQTSTRPTDRAWQVCVGSEDAFQVHRADFSQQMTFVHLELDFRYIPFHGIFRDDMNVIQSLADFSPPAGQKGYPHHQLLPGGKVGTFRNTLFYM